MPLTQEISIETIRRNDSVIVPQVPLPLIPVGGRLSFFIQQWQELGASDWHITILSQGLKLNFLQFPALRKHPYCIVLPKDLTRKEVLLQEVSALIDKRALEQPLSLDPGVYSHMFTVRKKSGGYRPVIDLKILNQHVRCPTFKMENDVRVKSQLKQGEWLTSVDLTDAYLHIPIHQDFRKFLRICIAGQVWQFAAMCFGLNIAPRIFTKMLSPVAAHLRTQGICIHRYLDDWLIRAPSQQESVQHTQYVVNLLTKLGWMINQQKSDLVPSQQITFLGMYIDLEAGFLAPTQEKIDKILLWSQFLHKSTVISVQQYLSLLGLLNNVSSLVKLGRLHLRPLQLYLASFGLDLRASLYDTIPLRPVFFTALMWWEHPEKLARGVELRTPPTQMTMFTDASRSGWGASILTHSAKGKWNHLDKQNHISVLELRAVRLGLQALHHLVTGKCIRVMSDNVATIAYIRNEGGTR